MTLEAPPRLDLDPLVRSFSILTKEARIVPFEPNWAQQEILNQVRDDYAEGKPSRIIVLKSRQLGISTVSEAILFGMSVTFPNTNAAVIAHIADSSEYLFSMTRRYYDTWRFKSLYPVKYSSKRHIHLSGLDSNIFVSTAENPDALRGRTLRCAHFSEVALYSDPVGLMGNANQAVPSLPGTIQLIESTAKGIGNWFHEAWEAAVEGKNEYTPFFFPWWKHYEYIPCQSFTCRDGSCETCQKHTKGLMPKDAEERDLRKLGCDNAHLAWRRWAIANRTFGNIDLFHQEFCSTPEEAFLSSGVNAFGEKDLKAVYERATPAFGYFELNKKGEVEFRQDGSGPWRIYKLPSGEDDWDKYFIGADPSLGSIDGDYAAAQVINRRTKEQVAVFHGRVLPGPFADELALAGKFYGTAIISPEINAGGIATIERLKMIYPRIWQYRVADRLPGKDISQASLGWATNWRTKTWMVMKLAEEVQKRKLIIHDEDTYKEMRYFTMYGGRGFGDQFGPADPLGHDDLVMALAIAIVCNSTEGPLAAYEVDTNGGGLIFPVQQEREPEWS